MYGAGRLELIPHYLLLAEANMGLERHKQAEEYLSLANWAVVKTPDVGLDVRSQLHRNFGKLYASQGPNPTTACPPQCTQSAMHTQTGRCILYDWGAVAQGATPRLCNSWRTMCTTAR